MKAFREQLEKLDEKTLDFATSQETKTLLGGFSPSFTSFVGIQTATGKELPGTMDGSLATGRHSIFY